MAATGIGALAGLIGGAVVTALSILFMLARGGDAWQAVKLPAYPFVGDDALIVGFDASVVAIGLLCHHAVSLFWGIVFVLLFRGIPLLATLVAGLAWGPVVWVNMYYVVLPLVGAGEVARIAPAPLAVLEHLLFALTLAAVLMPFQRMLARLELGWTPTFRRRRLA